MYFQVKLPVTQILIFHKYIKCQIPLTSVVFGVDIWQCLGLYLLVTKHLKVRQSPTTKNCVSNAGVGKPWPIPLPVLDIAILLKLANLVIWKMIPYFTLYLFWRVDLLLCILFTFVIMNIYCFCFVLGKPLKIFKKPMSLIITVQSVLKI